MCYAPPSNLPVHWGCSIYSARQRTRDARFGEPGCSRNVSVWCVLQCTRTILHQVTLYIQKGRCDDTL